MAIDRGIHWDFTFETWLDVWEKSGHLAQRGRNVGQYCMSRYGDTGPYSPSNVFIQLHGANTTDAHKGVPKGPQSTSHALNNKLTQQKLSGKACIVNGIEYAGVREAQRETKIAIDTIYRRISKGVKGYSWR